MQLEELAAPRAEQRLAAKLWKVRLWRVNDS